MPRPKSPSYPPASDSTAPASTPPALQSPPGAGGPGGCAWLHWSAAASRIPAPRYSHSLVAAAIHICSGSSCDAAFARPGSRRQQCNEPVHHVPPDAEMLRFPTNCPPRTAALPPRTPAAASVASTPMTLIARCRASGAEVAPIAVHTAIVVGHGVFDACAEVRPLGLCVAAASPHTDPGYIRHAGVGGCGGASGECYAEHCTTDPPARPRAHPRFAWSVVGCAHGPPAPDPHQCRRRRLLRRARGGLPT